MKKQYKIFVTVLTIILGVIFAPRIDVNAEILGTELYSYLDLNYIENGTVKIIDKGYNTEEKNYLYDIQFYDGSNYYYRVNRGLPPIYNRERDYITTYRVVDDENGDKRVFINFKGEDKVDIDWEVTEGDYVSNNVVEITSHKMEYKTIDGLGYYNVHFNVDIQMDTIYQIDMKYQTYQFFNLFGKIIKFGEENHNISIYREKVDLFPKFHSFIYGLLGSDDNYIDAIETSDIDGYQHKAFLQTAMENMKVEKGHFLKFYYVTNGNYYETDVVNQDDPFGNPHDSNDILLNMNNLLEELESMFAWFSTHLDTILIIIIGFFLTSLLAGFLPIITSVLNTIFVLVGSFIKFSLLAISLIIKIPFKVIIFLFNMIFNIGSKSKQKYKYKYKY